MQADSPWYGLHMKEASLLRAMGLTCSTDPRPDHSATSSELRMKIATARALCKPGIRLL